jgi:hypothetical protein
MLKKSPFSPIQPLRAKTRLFPSGVLASLSGSTLKSTPRTLGTLKGFFRSPRSIGGANGSTKCGPYILAASLAAALLNGLFEHPARAHCWNFA